VSCYVPCQLGACPGHRWWPAAAAVCDKRPASESGRHAPKWQARGSVLRGGGQGVRVRRRAGGEDQSGWARPEAGVAARVTITPVSCGAGAGKLRERGRF
jgi:hypothetical protein